MWQCNILLWDLTVVGLLLPHFSFFIFFSFHFFLSFLLSQYFRTLQYEPMVSEFFFFFLISFYKDIIGSLQNKTLTDRNILEDSYLLVKHFLDFFLWEYRFASFNTMFLKSKEAILYFQSWKSGKCFTK